MHSRFIKIIRMGELEVLDIQHPKFTAKIALQGAQLFHFQANGKAPLIWLSSTAQFKSGTSLRGGIPICWPWFGVWNKNPEVLTQQSHEDKGSHGFARHKLWHLENYKESAQKVDLKLSYTHKADDAWPFDCKVECHFILDHTLSLNLTTENLDRNAMWFSQAAHTYFPTPDIRRTHILCKGRQTYVDALDDWKVKPQNGAIHFSQEVDRIYQGQGDYWLTTPEKQIQVQSNSQSSVIWNPWIEKSKLLSQFSAEDYLTMLCIESANVLEDAVSLQPKETHTLSITYRD